MASLEAHGRRSISYIQYSTILFRMGALAVAIDGFYFVVIFVLQLIKPRSPRAAYSAVGYFFALHGYGCLFVELKRVRKRD